MSNEQEERWYVQFDSEEVRLMTLEELDDAFQKGLVHEETYVIPVGASEWQTLGELLGLGEGDESAEAAPPASAPPPLATIPAPPPASVQPPSARAPGNVTAVMAAVQPPQPALVSRWANPAPASDWPPVAVGPARVEASSPFGGAAYKPAQSVIPVVQDVSSADVDAAEFKPKKSKLVFLALGAAAVIGAAGVGIARLDTPPTDAISQAPAAAAAPYTPPAQPAAAPAPPTPAAASTTSLPSTTTAAATTPSTDSSESKAANDRLSEDMKKALLAQDDERAQQKKGRAKASATRRASAKSTATASKGPFKGGGSADDPLNPNL